MDKKFALSATDKKIAGVCGGIAEYFGVDSPNDLVKNKLGEYGETAKAWSSDDAKGFIKVSSTALRAYYLAHPDEER